MIFDWFKRRAFADSSQMIAEIERAGSVIALPAHAISIKNKHLLLACATNPRFHGGCFGVWGHTSSEALKL